MIPRPMEERVAVICEWLFHFEEPATGKKWTLGPFRNKVVTGGLENLAALLIGEVNSATAAMHTVMGTNSNAANVNDDLADIGETTRMVIASKTRSGAMAILKSYWGLSEGNGDYNCAGIVFRSTDTPNSGFLFNRIVQVVSKSETTTLMTETRVTFQEVT